MIFTKSKDEIEQIRDCGIITAELFIYLEQFMKPGITTKEIDKIADDFIIKHKAKPSFKGYHGFPASICASVNEEIIHGIPCNRKLKSGDIVGIDVGIARNGLTSDAARSYAIGSVSEDVKQLLVHTEKALFRGIKAISGDVRVNDISGAIEDYVTPFGYGIVREYCGHGVGYKLHEDPEVPNYRSHRGNKKLKPGTVIAIEPMINLGSGDLFVLEDGWTVVTIDGSYSAHFEHTVVVTENGFDILTILPEQKEIIEKEGLIYST